MTCLLLEYLSQPQRSKLIFFWQNENITKKTCIENNENHQSEDLDLTRQSAYKKTVWTNGFARVVFAVDG